MSVDPTATFAPVTPDLSEMVNKQQQRLKGKEPVVVRVICDVMARDVSKGFLGRCHPFMGCLRNPLMTN